MPYLDLLAVLPPQQAPAQSNPASTLVPCVRSGFWTAWLFLLAIHAAYLAHLLTKKARVKESERCSSCGKPKWECDCDLNDVEW